MSRTGLVAVQRQVRRDGKTFTQTVWIKPHHESKVDHKKIIEPPKWNLKTADDVKNEVGRINGIADRSERMVLKEDLLKHIETDMGVKWTKIPSNEKNAFGRNCLRAFSAAKAHLKANPGTSSPAPQAAPQPTAPASSPTPTGNGFSITKQPGTGYIMDRPASKVAAREFRDQHGMEETVKALKANGITWDEVAGKGPNNMRALRALASFIRHGGELSKGTTPTSAPQPVAPTPAPVPEPKKKEEPKSKYEKDSIMYDYEKAPKLHKAIALSVGILPTDEKSAAYLLEQIKAGEMKTFDEPMSDATFGIARGLSSQIDYAVQVVEKHKGTKNALIHKYNAYNGRNIEHVVKGTDLEDDFKTFSEGFEDLRVKHKRYAGRLVAEGISMFDKELTAKKFLDSVDEDWLDMSGDDLLDGIVKKFQRAVVSKDEALLNELQLIESTERFNYERKPLSILLSLTSSGRNDDYGVLSNYANAASDLALSRTGSRDTEAAVKAGKISLQELGILMTNELKNIKRSKQLSISTATRREALKSNNNDAPFPVIGLAVPEKKGERLKNEDIKATIEETAGIIEKISGKEMEAVVHNISIMMMFDGVDQSKLGAIRKEDYKKGNYGSVQMKMETAVKKRKTPELREKARKKYLKDIEENSTGYNNNAIYDSLVEGKDIDDALFPENDKASRNIKSSIATVEGSERSLIEKKVHETHDKTNHQTFTTKVLGVYRVKRIASEEKFQAINDKINTTGFYYHGTSVDTSQKILGQTGGFKVFTNKDSGKIKAGSMLGYGIYLASESSKSVQYIGNSFGRGTTRGTLMLCKASLGKVEQTAMRGADYNQPIMARPDVDCVFMDKPHVINPEWAVKRAEQAIPRLLIDVERVSK